MVRISHNNLGLSLRNSVFGGDKSLIPMLAILLLVIVSAFYTGASIGHFLSTTNCVNSSIRIPRQQDDKYVNSSISSSSSINSNGNDSRGRRNISAKVEEIVQQRVKAELSKAGSTIQSNHANANNNSPSPRFSKSVSHLANGIALTDKSQFIELFDYGPPMDFNTPSESNVLLLYNSLSSIPRSITNSQSHHDNKEKNIHDENSKTSSSSSLLLSAIQNNHHDIPILSAQDATQNCNSMSVITTSNPGNTNQCLAIVANHDSYHVQRWIRMSGTNTHDPKASFVATSRGMSKNRLGQFRSEFIPPSLSDMKQHWSMLRTYFQTYQNTLDNLKQIIDTQLNVVNNTIVVMTCNFGQSELLMNFICNSKNQKRKRPSNSSGMNNIDGEEDISSTSTPLDISNLLVFPTDLKTKLLVESLGVATFYDEQNFENLPTSEAKSYGDTTFVSMMFAKVICVQMVMQLGYNVLFQDADVIWYQNPLAYFEQQEQAGSTFDIYFQDDGAHSTRYTPYSANSGFYYIHNNAKTRYLFTSLLYSGDAIIKTKSHQQVLVQLLTEHASLFNLKVKILSRDEDSFPGGFHYHRRKEFMKRMMENKVESLEIFHMSWTKNKDDKIRYLQQMGEWFVNDGCIGLDDEDAMMMLEGGGDLLSDGMNNCCLVEANVKCHYKDKPSVIPCHDSPSIDKGGKSFW